MPESSSGDGEQNQFRIQAVKGGVVYCVQFAQGFGQGLGSAMPRLPQEGRWLFCGDRRNAGGVNFKAQMISNAKF